MMTTKRYDVIDKEEPRGQSVTYDGIPCTARHCCTNLNRLTEENEQLKKELQRMYDVATLNKAIEVLENKYDKMLSDGSDEVKDAMRHTVLRCIDDLDELKYDITGR